jgi:hypothetical protein
VFFIAFLLNLLVARSALRIVSVPTGTEGEEGDTQLPVPWQERVRRDDRREVTQGFPTEPVRSHGEAPPVIRSQLQSTATVLFPQETILFDQIRERLSLPTIQPASDGEEQQAEH